MKFRLYRYSPESGKKPHMQDVELDIDPAGKMLLDALLAIKAQDETLSLRRSCREGVCGSDAVNVNGKNRLA
ncbi:MAG: succinate dehydrogenase / fumarate reductase, iron-sulfur subunit, partial [Pseudomonadota bacterium]|nr:succinate dehydrogenase / fumarate reductase, iron-sulfur subunit [Pseudomonadota bacterium]